jgi:hypothetical protein
VLLLNAMFSLVTLVICYHSRRVSARFNPFYKSPYGEYGFGYQYDGGIFDLETWDCELAEYSSDFEKQCWTEKRAWEMAIAYCLMTFAAAAVAWGTLRMEKESLKHAVIAKREKDQDWKADDAA